MFQLGGSAEEDTEGMVIPGDDDRLSYVSAPASDYSVTTVGSEMLHSTTDLDDEDYEEHPLDKPVLPPAGSALIPPPMVSNFFFSGTIWLLYSNKNWYGSELTCKNFMFTTSFGCVMMDVYNLEQ